MSSLLRSGSSGRRVSGCRLPVIAVAASLGAAGCSADIARFDFPSANLNGPATGTLPPTPSEPVGGRYGLGAEAPVPPPSDTAYTPPPPPADRERIDVATLPPPSADPPRPVTRPATPPPAAAYATAPAPDAERGEEIEVKRGDTLYGLSKRHGVSLNELMRVNGLTSPVLKPGQKLALPVNNAPARQRPLVATATITPVPAPADWTGSYTIKPGDSLYGVARLNKVRLDDLQRYNGIADVRRVRPGTVLKVPGLAGAALAEAPAASPSAAPVLTPPPAPPVTAVAPPAGTVEATPTATPRILNSGAAEEKKVAALDPATATAVAAPAAGSVAGGKLRWPVNGRVIAGYGPRTDGTHNDGINISVPMGTDVHAAENGSVAYAGSELKGYGNLILLRHDNGLVTAYAHASELLVKRGDRVSRGQIIAKAGKTGAVDQPQLHFEVRRDQTPVDPTSYLERN